MKLLNVGHVAAASLCGALLLSGAAPAFAQQDSSRGLRATVSLGKVAVGQEPLIEFQNDYGGWGREVLRIGQKFELKQGETVQDVVSVLTS